MIASVSIVDAVCYGSSDGSASVSVTGGTAGYNFTWSGSTSVSQNASGFPAGAYSVTVTDANGCSLDLNFTVNEPSPILITALSDSVSCAGFSDGAVVASVINGVPPFSYDWGFSAQNNDTLDGVLAGSYSMIVTDDDGCTATATATVSEPTSLSISIVSNPVSCFGGSNGSVRLS